MAPAPKDLNVGDTVDILHLNTRGTVLSKPDAKGDVQLQAGIMKLKANLSQLRLVQEKKPKKQKSPCWCTPRPPAAPCAWNATCAA